MTRQMIQKRGQWRAVLPHPIANRLEKDALKNIHPQSLTELFERPDNQRLLKSFAKRLGHLYDDENAQRIVQRWVQDGGILDGLCHDWQIDVLEIITPVDPKAVLELIEKTQPEQHKTQHILHEIAYEPALFERALTQLERISESRRILCYRQ